MKLDGPLTAGGLRVCREKCSTCIFHPGNRMHLRPGCVASMVSESIANDSFIPCHKTLDGERAVCRGFWDSYHTMTLGCRLASVVGLIEVEEST